MSITPQLRVLPARLGAASARRGAFGELHQLAGAAGHHGPILVGAADLVEDALG